MPDYTAPTNFKYGTGTTTPIVTQTDLTTAVGTKAIASGYPLFDEPNYTCTIRGILLTTEANGNSLTEFGLFNTDGSPKMFSRAVHTAITKTTSVQVIYKEKDKVS